jgi:phosphoglycerate dehydrogenase-like enzyme
MRVLFCGSGWLPMIEILRERARDSTIEMWDRRVPLVDAVCDIDVLLPSNARITAEVIAAASKLRLIQQPAAGTEEIDLAAATARGIPVCNATNANHISVAEHALFLLLALARRAPEAARAFANREVGVPLGIELAGKTLGIVGMGKTGSALADRARALGMTVVPMHRDTPRESFWAMCDAISLHCPLNDETRGMIDHAAFAAMRDGALLVNVARGGVIDRAAVVEALRGGKLGGVGLDVHWHEPPDPDDDLYRDPRVVALPHLAGSTREAFSRIADIVVDNLARLARGDELRHRIA